MSARMENCTLCTQLQAKASEIKKNPNSLKIFLSKLLLCLFLLFAAASITTITFLQLSEAEYNVFANRFDSLADNGLNSVVSSLSRMDQGIQGMSSTISNIFTDADMWPNVAWSGFLPSAKLLGSISSVGGLAVLPIVRPVQVAEYENFINAYYDTDKHANRNLYFNPYFPDGTIFGVRDVTAVEPEFFADRFGNSTDSPNNILVPLAQYTMHQLVGPHQISYNVHSNFVYTKAIDGVIACAAAHNFSYASTACGTISSNSPMPRPTPADPRPVTVDVIAVFMHPIFPANNEGV